jgi:hypothetical protein
MEPVCNIPKKKSRFSGVIVVEKSRGAAENARSQATPPANHGKRKNKNPTYLLIGKK